MSRKPIIDAETGVLSFVADAPAPFRPRNSFFEGAAVNRFTQDWVTRYATYDTLLENSLTRLRARSKQLVSSDGVAQSIERQSVTNLVGEGGFRLKVNALNKRGRPDKELSKQILKKWREFCRSENFTVTGNMSEQEFDCLMVKTLVSVGGGLVRKVRGFENGAKYAVQGISAELLDPEYHDTNRNIFMSVQKDEWGREQAFHVLKNHPGDGIFHGSMKAERIAIPADQAIHVFVKDEFGQTQGKPWMTPVIARLRQLHGYEEAELVAARAQASKIGFFEEEWDSAGYEGEGTNEIGDIKMNGEPGSFERLPPGVKANLIDPSHPNGNYPDFRKGILRGVTAGVIANYNISAEDLEGVSYSSIRQGTLAERDQWKIIQRWYVEQVKKPLFSDWLEWMLLTSGIDGCDIRDFDRCNWPEFQGRRWDWVDPDKDSKAEERRLKMRLTSHQRLARNRGEDLEEILEEVREDEALAEKGPQQLDLFLDMPQETHQVEISEP